MISQKDAARLMFAADKMAKARGHAIHAMNSPRDTFERAKDALQAAERAFAELVATLTDSEGL